MKALQRALALRREERIGSVNEFLELMNQNGVGTVMKWLAVAAMVAMIVAYLLWKAV
jgi:hypothetical protein